MKIQSSDFTILVEEKPKELRSTDLQQLLKEELQALEAIQNAKRKIEFATSRFLLRRLLGTRYSAITYEQSGKPTMQGIPISISHSNNHVAVIVGTTNNVAIDIEEYRPQIFRVTEKFVRQDEKGFSSLEDLILLWCAKETIFKLTNASYDFLDFRVQKCSDTELRGEVMIGERLDIINISYFRNEKYCLVWTSEKK